MDRPKFLSTAEVARRAGVHRDTLHRWLREGRVGEPRRDHKGWRVFSESEAQRIERFAKALSGPSLFPLLPAEIERLQALDWDFVGAKTDYLTHGLHPYPAKFIPQIPNALIQELSSVGETVADIFCGSGTTLVEALTLKRHAVGIDASPLACLISQAKTALVEPSDAIILTELVSRAVSMSADLADMGRCLFPNQHFVSRAPRPDSDAIGFWFEPFVIEELAEILSWCNQIASVPARQVALAAFSAIVVNVSKQDSDTRYVRRQKNLQPGDAFKRFGRSLADAVHDVVEFSELVERRFGCRVLNEDLLKGPDIGDIDLVVCSPPYPNAYSYHLYHMTRMLWLNMDQPSFKRVEIGSHRKYSRKGATIATFREEMKLILEWLQRHLRSGRHACLVLGDSIVKGTTISNVDIIAEVAGDAGYIEVSRISRDMQETKKAFNPAIGKIKKEQILILQSP